MSQQQHPAGWYNQPDGTQRYWDGIQWTNQVAPGVGAAEAAAQVSGQGLTDPKGKPWYKKKRILIPAVVVLAIAAWPRGGGDDPVTAAPASTPSISATVSSAVPVSSPAATPTVSSPAPVAIVEEVEPTPSSEPTTQAAEVPAEPEAPGMTVSQEQAVKKALEYLEYTSFSLTGLVEQLEYEGFSNADATFAVNNILVDWTTQADLKAKEYLEYTSFSRASLIDQLIYEGFTPEQAEHGATSVGL